MRRVVAMMINDAVANTPIAIVDVLPSRKQDNIIFVGICTSILFIDVYCKDTRTTKQYPQRKECGHILYSIMGTICVAVKV